MKYEGERYMKRMLIAYYSWSNGNTKRIAEALWQATGSDICRIETERPYEGEYNAVVARGQAEVQDGYEPPIKPLPYDAASYDVVAVGTPTWWYTMAPAVKTFLSSREWRGKIVVPFSTHAGWPGHAIKDIGAICRGADCRCAMEFKFASSGGSTLETPQAEVEAWIQNVANLLQ